MPPSCQSNPFQGANKGIGLAVVERVLSERPDAFVFLGSRDAGRGAAAAASLAARHPGRVEAVQVDVSSDASVAAAAKLVEGKVGKGNLHALVNNAGIYSSTPGECVAINLKGVKRVTDAFAPLLAADGRVVNVSSGAGPSFVSGCSEERKGFFSRKDATFAEVRPVCPGGELSVPPPSDIRRRRKGLGSPSAERHGSSPGQPATEQANVRTSTTQR